MLALFRAPGPLRRFLLAHAQSGVGVSAGYVALLVLAYDRLQSPWAVSLVLLADFLPGVVLGPLCGAAADRWSRRGCAVAADIIRAVAFAVIAFASSFELTVLAALAAGAGTALFRPAAKAALPTLAGDRLPLVVATHAMLADVGVLAGPALAGALLLVAPAEIVIAVTAASFAVSAVTLLSVPMDGDRVSAQESLWLQARAGLAHAARMPFVRTVIVTSGAALLAGALMNVGEPLLAQEVFGLGGAGFAGLVLCFGAGAILGSWASSRSAGASAYRSRYLLGFALTGAGLLASAAAPWYTVALATFVLTGFGTAVLGVHEQQLLQTVTADEWRGRVFGVKDAADSLAFVVAFLIAGGLIELFGVRALFAISGAAVLLAGALAARLLRGNVPEPA